MRPDPAWLLVTALLVAPTAAQTQDLTPLAAWENQPAESRDPSYPLVRCAGLYAGILYLLGEGADANLGAEGIARFETAILALGLSAVTLRAAEAGEPPDSMEIAQGVRDDEFVIAMVYQERMLENHQAAGTAILGDALITGDLETCAPHARRAIEAQGGTAP